MNQKVIGAKVQESVVRLVTRVISSTIEPSAVEIDDPFAPLEDYGRKIIKPIYPPEALVRLVPISNMLPQLIRSMGTNICGQGHHFECIVPDDKRKGLQKQIDEEKERLDMTWEYFHPFESFTMIHRKIREDRETAGGGFLEAARDNSNMFAGGSHVPVPGMRLTMLDERPVKVEVKRVTKDYKIDTAYVWVKFRRYVQLVGGRSNKKIFFKQFGDPRGIDRKTGLVVPAKSKADATEIIHFVNYSPLTPYGLPRWIGNLPSIIGSAKAEILNLDLMMGNMIPALLMMVAGGVIPDIDKQQLEDSFNELKEKGAANKILIVSAVPAMNADNIGEAKGQVRMHLEQLVAAQHKDALFQDYDAKNRKKLRSAFNLSAMFSGESEDVRYANAIASIAVAESQVFGPERKDEDFLINRLLLSDMGVVYHKFVSDKPDITDVAELANIIQVIGQHGGMTPNRAIKVWNLIMKDEVPKITEPWGDQPVQFKVEEIRSGLGGGLPVQEIVERASRSMVQVMTKALTHIYEHARRKPKMLEDAA